MKTALTLAIALLGRILFVLGDCVPHPVEPPDFLDPNAIQGLLLPADPNDPNDWHAPVGKWNRVGAWCDPDGDSITIALKSSTVPGAQATIEAARWRIAGDLAPRRNLFVVEATDIRQWQDEATSVWTVAVWGDLPPNHSPVLY